MMSEAMPDWFEAEQLDSDTYAISEPRHWEETHCFLLCGSERAALIDTGLGVANIKAVVDRLTPLPVTVLTTHAHWDHIGGHASFADIGIHEAERDWLSVHFPLPLQVVKKNLLRKPCDFPKAFNADAYHIFKGAVQRVFRDGDRVDLGGRSLTVLHTPGHSPGHCCFYDPDRQDLYAGDLVYRGCLDAFYPTTDPLLFAQSIQRVRSLTIRRVLPAHHQLHIPVELIGQIDQAFSSLQRRGSLVQGSGRFDFGAFQIHL